MRCSFPRWRALFSAAALLLSATGMAAACLFTQQQPPSQPAPQPTTPQKPGAKNQPPTRSPSLQSLIAQAKPDDYIGEDACTGCHQAAVEGYRHSPISSLVNNPDLPLGRKGCQGCHGPAANHLAHLDEPDQIRKYIFSYTTANPRQIDEACLRCHEDQMRPAQYHRREHGRAGVSCVACHNIHHRALGEPPAAQGARAARSVRVPFFVAAPDPGKLLQSDEVTMCGSCHAREVGEFRHNFHHPLPEGRLLCSSCHEIHPRRAAEKLQAAVTRERVGMDRRELCVTCHADKAGPFLHEHDPATGGTGDGCLDCHRPHGSPNPSMVSTFSRGLCMQCHSDKGNNHHPGRTCWQAGCHVAVHGSNSSELLFAH